MARTWGQGRKLPKSSAIGSQSGFLQEDESGTTVDGVKWTPASEIATAIGIPDVSEADDGQILVVEDGVLVVGDASGGATFAHAVVSRSYDGSTPSTGIIASTFRYLDELGVLNANGTGITWNGASDQFENIPAGTVITATFHLRNAGVSSAWKFQGRFEVNASDEQDVYGAGTEDLLLSASVVQRVASASQPVKLKARYLAIADATNSSVDCDLVFQVPAS